MLFSHCSFMSSKGNVDWCESLLINACTSPACGLLLISASRIDLVEETVHTHVWCFHSRLMFGVSVFFSMPFCAVVFHLMTKILHRCMRRFKWVDRWMKHGILCNPRIFVCLEWCLSCSSVVISRKCCFTSYDASSRPNETNSYRWSPAPSMVSYQCLSRARQMGIDLPSRTCSCQCQTWPRKCSRWIPRTNSMYRAFVKWLSTTVERSMILPKNSPLYVKEVPSFHEQKMDLVLFV